MLRDDLAELIDGRVSREGTKEVLRAADAIRQVQRMLGHPLPEVVREAIVALNLDIDMQLAEHMRGRSGRCHARRIPGGALPNRRSMRC